MRHAVYIALLLSVPVIADAQRAPTATASIAIIARLPGSVTLAQDTFPIDFVVSGGSTTPISISVPFRWNLDPRQTQSFQLVAHFGSHLPWIENIQASTDGRTFRALTRSGQLVLINRLISVTNREGQEQLTFTLFLNLVENPLPDGQYHALLRLDARRQ